MLEPNLPTSFSAPSHVFLPSVVLDEPPLRENLERIRRLAMNLFDVPMTTISFADEQRTQFKLLLQEEVVDIPYDSSFCRHVLLQEEIFNIPETLSDARFCNHPSVSGSPHIRFYAGCPFQMNPRPLGAISIADRTPRYFSPSHLLLLKDLAALIETELQNYVITTDKGRLASDLKQARMASMIDPLTSLWNRQGMYNILKYRMEEYLLGGTSFAVAILDIDRFKSINDTYGHDAGDQVLITVAKSLRAGCRDTDAVGRWGGEEFLLLINESDPNNALEIAERIRTTIASQNIPLPSGPSFKPTVTIGLTTIIPGSYPTPEELICKADQALYQGKRSGRNRVIEI